MATISSKPTFFPKGEIDNTGDSPLAREPLVLRGKNFMDVTNDVCSIPENPPTIAWYAGFAFSLSLLGLFGATIGYLVTTGVGVFGNNQPVSWAFPIINFVFWVGIGHAGTLISAVLFLFRQRWRTGINRFAEAMTIFAVCCAGIFPAIHVGRPWLAYWLFPLPNQMEMWPQFRSPLLWDVFAVSTYATVSTLFWYTGMVPDIATLRDRAKNKVGQFVYGIAALGWNGSSRHWHRFEKAYLLLAGLCTPLVLSVHSIVSFDFAVSQLPGWHTTFFPPYFVGGAIYGGFAMVLTLAIPARQWFGLKDIITMRHIDNMCKIMLGVGLIVSYCYALEFFIAWYSQSKFEQFAFINRAFGNYAWSFWMLVFLNVLFPQLLWFKRFRMNIWVVLFVAMCINVGMWFERYVIVITTLTRDFLPSSWGNFYPTWVDLGMFAGSFGLFFTLFMLFCRFLPMVAMAEVKSIMPEAHLTRHGHGHHTDAAKSDYNPGETDRPRH